MSDEVEVQEDEVEVNPSMEKAMADGWKPQDQWEGDPKQWVDYDEFNFRGELFGRISEQSSVISNQARQIKEFQAALEDMKNMQNKMAENEYNKLMKQLKAQRREAMSEGEIDIVDDIEEQMDQLREAHQSIQEAPKRPDEEVVDNTVHPEVHAWLSNPNNQWYNTDKVLQGAANSIAADIAQSHPEYSPGQVLREMEGQLRKELPHKFPRSAVGTGDQGTKTRAKSSRRSKSDLNSAELEAGQRFVKLGVFKSMDDYIEQLDAIGE